MSRLRVGGIVLAAGRSTRMGEQKLLLPWEGTTVIGNIAEAARNSELETVVVVSGSDAAAVEMAAGPQTPSFLFARNPDVDQGMLSSVRTGLRALPENLDGVLLLLGDQPSVSTALIDGLISFAEQNQAAIALPVKAGKRGHPLYFSMAFRDEVLHDFDAQGLRGLLARHPDAIHEWPVADHGVLEDLDTPEDYARARPDA